MEKSREAFRTISEVAEWLDVPTHVLRFWESRFSQIKPVKRAGGRRYYRPSDMRVIGGVKTLLHDQGMTIRGVQKMFREQGVKHVSSFSPALYGADGAEEDSDDQLIEAQVVAEPDTQIAPSPAARTTRDATPDPVLDADEAQTEDEAPAVGEPVFIHRRALPVQDEAQPSEPEPELALVAVSEPEETPEPEQEPELEAPPPAIPATPDVPATDIGDDDPSHPPEPGLAGLVATARRSRLRSQPETLIQVVDRLKDLRARLD